MPSTRTETITTSDGGRYEGHLTVPGNGRGPGILLLQEIFGVGEFLLSKANDLAELGYVVMCPDVFWRVEPGIALPHDEGALQEAFGYMTRYMSEVPDETKVTDLGAALDHLRSLPEVAGQKSQHFLNVWRKWNPHREVMDRHHYSAEPALAELLDADRWARQEVARLGQ